MSGLLEILLAIELTWEQQTRQHDKEFYQLIVENCYHIEWGMEVNRRAIILYVFTPHGLSTSDGDNDNNCNFAIFIQKMMQIIVMFFSVSVIEQRRYFKKHIVVKLFTASSSSD